MRPKKESCSFVSRAPVIAMDGPAASGKTVVGLRLARRLGYRFIDTGTMYRAVTWLALERGVPLEDEEALSRIAASVSIAFGDVPDGDAPPKVYVEGRDLSAEIRTPAVDRAVSQVSKVSGVRNALVKLQRAMARRRGVVMVGRDIGTVVLPRAELKVFLLASAEERAGRRHLELIQRGVSIAYEDVLSDLKRRDRLDTERAISPLVPAADARLIDTDNQGIDEVVERIWRLAEKG